MHVLSVAYVAVLIRGILCTFLAICCKRNKNVNFVIIGVLIENTIEARYARHTLTRGGGDGV